MSAKAQKTAEQTIAANQTIDFRKDPAPTDWLSIRVAKFDGSDVDDLKVEEDYHREFVERLEGLRCEPDCASAGCVSASGNEPGGKSTAGHPMANSRLPASCVCSLVEQLSSPDVDLLVPKSEFVAVVRGIGLSQEQALEQYRNYVTKKVGDKYDPEFERLWTESQNAYNWVSELGGGKGSYKTLEEVGSEMDAVYDQMVQEVEDILATP